MNETQPTENPTVLLQKMHRWRMAFFGLVILLAGVVIGAASALLITRRLPQELLPAPEFAAARMVGRLQRQLRLTSDQTDRIRAILERHIQRLNEIRMDARPLIANELKIMNEEISTVLRQDQFRIWQNHLQRLQGELLRPRLGPERRFRGGRESLDYPPSLRPKSTEPEFQK
jgi:hypothetical protein